MTENKKIPENKPLTDEQLTNVSGGNMNDDMVLEPVGFKRCADDPTHIYLETLKACPVCGCRAFTRA